MNKSKMIVAAAILAACVNSKAVPFLDVLVNEYQSGVRLIVTPQNVAVGTPGDFYLDGTFVIGGEPQLIYLYNNLGFTPVPYAIPGNHTATFTFSGGTLVTDYTIVHDPELVDIPLNGISYLGDLISSTHFGAEPAATPDGGSTAGLGALAIGSLLFARRKAHRSPATA